MLFLRVVLIKTNLFYSFIFIKFDILFYYDILLTSIGSEGGGPNYFGESGSDTGSRSNNGGNAPPSNEELNKRVSVKSFNDPIDNDDSGYVRDTEYTGYDSDWSELTNERSVESNTSNGTLNVVSTSSNSSRSVSPTPSVNSNPFLDLNQLTNTFNLHGNGGYIAGSDTSS